MGAAKTVANMYTYNEYLYYYINAKNTKEVEDILKKRPNLIKDPLTAVSKVTALNQVATTNNIQLAGILIQNYKADVNLASPKGQTPLISAIRKNHIEMVRFLLSKGADPNYIDKIGLKTIQYAILQGLYQISYILLPLLKDKQLRPAEEYVEMGKKYNYRYVNYEMMIANLEKMVEPEKVDNFLVKKRIILSDPVIDPRQTWKQWFVRNLDFKDPPLVERLSLPVQLRPQNRRFGKISHFFGKLAMTPTSQQPSYKPSTQSQFIPIGNRVQQVNSQQIEMNSVA